MVAFLVEAYCSAEELAAGRARLHNLGDATRNLGVGTLPVRLLHAVFVPDDETCLYVFEATSAEAVLEATDRIGLRFERLTEAVSAWPNSLEEGPPRHGDDPLAAVQERAAGRAATRARGFASAP